MVQVVYVDQVGYVVQVVYVVIALGGPDSSVGPDGLGGLHVLGDLVSPRDTGVKGGLGNLVWAYIEVRASTLKSGSTYLKYCFLETCLF